MTWQAALAVRDTPGIDPTAKYVLLCIALRANTDGRAWPSIATLCADTGKGQKTVRRAIRYLVENGHLEVIHKPGAALIMTMNRAHYDPNRAHPGRGKSMKSIEGAAIAADGNGAGAAVRSRGHPDDCRCHGDGLVVTPNGVFACGG